MRIIQQLRHWQFRREEGPVQEVTVPHDWAIAGPFDRENDNQHTRVLQDGETQESEHNGRTGGLPHTGHGEYRRTLAGPSAPGRRVFLTFEGAMSHAQVHINGQKAYSRNFGYSTFTFDATPFLRPGGNELSVTLDNPPNASRWYPGAGLFRPVWRIETDAIHFDEYTPHLEFLPMAGQLRLRGRLVNHTARRTGVTMHFSSPLFDARTVERTISPDGTDFDEVFDLNPFECWSPETPALYPVTVGVQCGDARDEVTLRTGLRTIEFNAEQGLLVNGTHTKINGVCLHHDLGPLGAAFNLAAARRQLLILKEMGCNAIRTSHNPPAPGLLDLCDELGFMVMDEAFDVWRFPKVANDYSRHFDDDSELDLSTLVCRDRNHPCVILWSIGNELTELSGPEMNGAQTAARLVSIVKKHDRTRPVTAGMDRCEAAIESGIPQELDIPGWNYRPQKYAAFHQLFPHVPVLGSETMSSVSSRGVYYFPATEYVNARHPRRPEHNRLQCSSYALDCGGPWCQTPEAEFIAQDQNGFVAGQFIWTGFDYLGEPTPYITEWPTRSSYFGLVDLVGLPKDIYYLLQSQWTEEPMMHIVPHHWNWQAGQKLDIHLFTNCDEAELFVNGRSLGRQGRFPASGVLAERYRIIWHGVEWEPGSIRAVGYRSGVQCAEESLQTAGAPAKLRLASRRTVCSADGEDMLFATVEAVDSRDVPCPDADCLVRFHLTGSASMAIAAADAGNAASTEPFPLPECSLFSGKAVVYLKSTGSSGRCTLHAESAGLSPAALELAAE